MDITLKTTLNNVQKKVMDTADRIDDVNKLNKLDSVGKDINEALQAISKSVKSQNDETLSNFYNRFITTCGTNALNSDDPTTTSKSIKSNIEYLNNKAELELDQKDIDDISKRYTKLTTIIEGFQGHGMLAMNSVRNISNEYVNKTKVPQNAYKVGQFTDAANRIMDVHGNLSMLTPIVCNTIATIDAFAHSPKFNIAKKTINVFNAFVSNIFEVIRDVITWNVKYPRDDIRGLLERLFYGAALIAIIISWIVVVGTPILWAVKSSLDGTQNKGPFMDLIRTPLWVIGELLKMLNRVGATVAIYAAAATVCTAFVKTIEELMDLKIIDIIIYAGSKSIDFIIHGIGSIFRVISNFVRKYADILKDKGNESRDKIENKQTAESPEEEDRADRVDDDLLGDLLNNIDNYEKHNIKNTYRRYRRSNSYELFNLMVK